MMIARLLGIAPDSEAWGEIVAETGELAAEAFDRLEAVETDSEHYSSH